MASYTFHAFGHDNMLGTHGNTLEFTKDKELTKKGDCIIGVGCDFELSGLKRIISCAKKAKMIIEWPNGKEEVSFELNSLFSSNHELVIRKTGFVSERTLGINSDKSSYQLNRRLIEFLKDGSSKVKVTVEIL
jgi:uncharacterized protein